ncbi:MAG: hypothetical protein HN820_03640 [Candidatus Marinimicrobia bacterium]|nr:hypothetical protein [Candidatus Neomarinimicrobiota bacterium]MBT7377232.1 hypothetical protein [Candidatus Neomarinimicrobiota bacterium]
MESYLAIYPALTMIFLTFFLYVKNRMDAGRAYRSKEVEPTYFKVYNGKAPHYLETSRQTLKNQFELPVIFYFFILLFINFENISIFELILCWLFSISRYLHVYIRLSSNHVPYRAKVFTFGLIILCVLSFDLIIKISKL